MGLRTQHYPLPPPVTASRPIQANVPFIPQFLSQWCWAACAAMVASGRHLSVTQCMAANLLIKGHDCCASVGTGCSEFRPARGDANPGCNQVAHYDEVSALWQQMLGTNIQPVSPLRESELMDALEAGDGHAVQVWWVDGGSNHVVLVVGHADGEYLVHDPCERERLMSYRELLEHDSRTWRLTWIL